MSPIRKEIYISGIVQGVGFRPFVYQLAHQHQLKGWVRNDFRGVFIHAQGCEDRIEQFLDELQSNPPPQARIDSVAVRDIPLEDDETFQIVLSRETNRAGAKQTSIPPDIALCEDCRREMLDPSDRRYGYPFINCTNCGPRFTIITGMPYDRPFTTMAGFTMCPDCRCEYEDPRNRRYHAQPIACHACGPQVELRGPEGQFIQTHHPLQVAAECLRKGQILAVKGLGGFHLACDATSVQAVTLLRARKHRPSRPLAVMVAGMREAQALVLISPRERELLTGSAGPIVLLRKQAGNSLAENVAPGLDELGVMPAYTPLHELLCRSAGIPLVMTSGNLSDEPLCIDNQEAYRRLRGIADLFLVHNREIVRPCDDSVLRVVRGKVQMLRRSRGFAPLELHLDNDPECPSVLALGGDLKNTCCVTTGLMAIPSQHLGDLELTVSQEHAQRTCRDLQRLLSVSPRLLAYDRHPGYISRQLAERIKSEHARNDAQFSAIEVQHHHAHLVSVLAEHGLHEEVIGLIWDGTGYGDDGTIWGGEILLGDRKSYRRVGCIESIPIVGGDQAVKEPWRVALAWLYRVFPEQEAAQLARELFQEIPPDRLALVTEALHHQRHTVACCSMGRLFDAVAVLAGLAINVTYEGEAAIALEQAVQSNKSETDYVIPVNRLDRDVKWHLAPLMQRIVRDRLCQRPVQEIAFAFHHGVITAAMQSIRMLREIDGTRSVVLSGGCFQNRVLLAGLSDALEAEKIPFWTNEWIPCNDGGLSFGQAAVAAACYGMDVASYGV